MSVSDHVGIIICGDVTSDIGPKFLKMKDLVNWSKTKVASIFMVREPFVTYTSGFVALDSSTKLPRCDVEELLKIALFQLNGPIRFKMRRSAEMIVAPTIELNFHQRSMIIHLRPVWPAIPTFGGSINGPAVLIDGISGIDFPDLIGVAADAMNSATLQEEVVVECLCQAIVNS